MTGKIVAVQTTVSRTADAERLARLAIERRLAACVQWGRIRSRYRWKGRVECADELLLTAKTRARLQSALMCLLAREHPYELPEMVAFPLSGVSPEYRRWVFEQTAPAGRPARARAAKRKE